MTTKRTDHPATTETRCPRCGHTPGWGHNPAECAQFHDDIDAAVARARQLGLPTDRAARLVGDISAEVPPPHRLPAVLAAIEAWAASVRRVVAVAPPAPAVLKSA